ncbi:hypothetical protein G7Y79_00034g069480 [Physcia stellaris]|nr:hypothetical protein G7Y79_00034g069480 [Physcia stellaris]
MFQIFRNRQYKYEAVNGGSRVRSHYKYPTIWITTAIVVASALTGFYTGRLSVSLNADPGINLSNRKEIFRYNRTFGAAPSNLSNAAWASIFPEQGGFFKHPDLAPQRSAWAVFHQLHCLDGIRQGYWALHSAAIVGEKVDDSEIPMMYSPAHIRHCIDLIRQSLMCQPDLTVEVKDPEIGGVTGFGTQHQCKDWGELIAWTRKWQAWKQDPRVHGHGDEREHAHHGHDD